ncbi:MAG: DNA polymerase III subunit alpha [Candidatus Saccharibacteria bacterium]|nr:DNA polymerase III subunit alpha [Candidatus Saccharibacteria bacterium]
MSKNNLQPSDFVHLHNHTHYSVLDGLTKVNELIARTKEFGMEAVAITDHGTMSGVLDFYKTAKDAGVKPILGIEAYVAERGREDRDPQFDKTRYHITLLAKSYKGYQNLMALSSIANLEGFYYRPRIDHQLMEKYSEDVICLSGCANGEVSQRLRKGDYDGARKMAKWYHSVYGDNFYLEMQDHGHPESPAPFGEQTIVNEGLKKLAKELNLPLVVTCDGHYLNLADRQVHEILLCVGTGAYLSDTRRMSLKDLELYLTDPKDIIDRWGDEFPEAILNTKKIAEQCNVDITLGQILIPKYPLPTGELDEKSYLMKLVYNGAVVRYAEPGKQSFDNINAGKTLSIKDCKKLIPQTALDRMEMELEVIDRMGYFGYFLIVQDFINWGRQQGIIFGPGRGSAAGAIIAYCLRITDLDPLKYDLLFERFLNPDRISMPDIDVDIQDDRRDEVIQYCVGKYGDARVSNIVTFGKMAARSAAKDVARVLEIPYAESDRLSKMIPSLVQGRHVPLSKSVKEDPDLSAEYNGNPQSKQILDYAMRLEGTIRSHGVHACGIVIAPDDLVKYLPLEKAQKGVVATQFPMGQVEELGLLKMDFLGLSNLSIIKNTLRIIKKVYKTNLEIASVPLDDEATFKLFQRGDTTGVFQLESAGMKKYLKELAPTHFEDIIAMVALYRPGPMQFIDSFIRRKHGEEPITYLHEKMEPALKNTYGILVYQEQFMQISKELAGFTGGQADTLRKAVGKKKLDLMAQIKPQLIEGALKNSDISRQKIELFWDQLQEFANYCFNKSHAACYGLIAYWTAYLKAHYPSAFMAALMTSAKDETERLAIMIAECNHANIEVMAPDVNESFVEFAIVPGTNKIRFGMAAVKGVGEAIVEEVLEIRKDGKFTSIVDFAKRMAGSKFNKKAWNSLIKTGAFDSFGYSRSDLLENLDRIQGYMSKCAKEALSGQSDLFAGMGAEMSVPDIEIIPAKTPASQKEQLQWERELLGLYISAHPLDKYEQFLREKTVNLGEITESHDSKTMEVGGILTEIRNIITKKGDKMAFLTIEDKLNHFSVVVFPKLFKEIEEILVVDKVIMINGRISAKDRDGNPAPPQIIANEITEITELMLSEFNPNFRKKKTPRGNYEAFLEVNGAKKIGSDKQKAIGPSPIKYNFIDPDEELRLAREKKMARDGELEPNMLTKENNNNNTKQVAFKSEEVDIIEMNEKKQTLKESSDSIETNTVGTDNVIDNQNKAKPITDKSVNIGEKILVAKEGSLQNQQSSRLYVRLIDASNQKKLIGLRQSCSKYPGSATVILVLGDDSNKTAIKLPFGVDLNNGLLTELTALFLKSELVIK